MRKGPSLVVKAGDLVQLNKKIARCFFAWEVSLSGVCI